MDKSVEFSLDTANELLEKLHQHQQQFFFSKKELFTLSRESIEPLLQKTCEEIAKMMHFERVEIWLFNEDQTKLMAETNYDCRGSKTAFDKTLYQHKVPAYFESIVDQRTLAINDIATSPIMDGLRESLSEEYHQMKSMLDASIIFSWGVGGVLCCLSEQQREWMPIHRHILASVADMLAFIFDRLHRREVEDHVYELAFTDVLTGLNNQHAFHEKVNNRLRVLPKGEKAVFIYMMIDQFTDIQAVLGYEGGEQVLIEIANRLKNEIPNFAIIARIGFDHFVLYAPVNMNRKTTMAEVKRLTNALRKPMDINGQEVYITFSYGVAYYPDHISSVKEGLQAAQVALEDAKQKASRKATGVYEPSMHDFMKENLLSEINLRKGLDALQFRLYYQPQVNCDTGELIGFEALIRWVHPERGLILPGGFINLAESTGLIVAIGNWVIQEAFAQLSKWKAQGNGHLTLSINVSPVHFISTDLPSYLLACTNQTGIEPHKLTLEITENVAFENQEQVKRRISELRKLGFGISIDDFGTGYSAFVYLQHYAIDQIKIDRQFIKDIHKNSTSALITNAIVQLGKSLKLQTLAEGVETAEEWHYLKDIGCDEIQGYYFSKPLPIEEVTKLLASKEVGQKIHLP